MPLAFDVLKTACAARGTESLTGVTDSLLLAGQHVKLIFFILILQYCTDAGSLRESWRIGTYWYCRGQNWWLFAACSSVGFSMKAKETKLKKMQYVTEQLWAGHPVDFAQLCSVICKNSLLKLYSRRAQEMLAACNHRNTCWCDAVNQSTHSEAERMQVLIRANDKLADLSTMERIDVLWDLCRHVCL